MKYEKLIQRTYATIEERAARTVIGWNDQSRVRILDGKKLPLIGLPDEVMTAMYKKIPAPACGYVPDVFDCENFSRWYAARVVELWARIIDRGIIKDRGLLDQGMVTGKIPVGNLEAGNHAVNFFYNDKGKFRMWEPQRRELVLIEDVAITEEIWELEYH